jgi:hypothetical protein
VVHFEFLMQTDNKKNPWPLSRYYFDMSRLASQTGMQDLFAHFKVCLEERAYKRVSALTVKFARYDGYVEPTRKENAPPPKSYKYYAYNSLGQPIVAADGEFEFKMMRSEDRRRTFVEDQKYYLRAKKDDPPPTNQHFEEFKKFFSSTCPLYISQVLELNEEEKAEVLPAWFTSVRIIPRREPSHPPSGGSPNSEGDGGLE